MTNRKEKYPEHAKLHAVKDKSQACGEFLRWLVEEKREFEQTGFTGLQDLLAEFFEIDQNRLEREKQQMLEELRNNA